jgi:Zn-dependent membrane protease YugP
MVLIILIVFAVLALMAGQWASGRYEAMMSKGARVVCPTAHNGAEIARLFLASEQMEDVQVVEHDSVVSDYFDRKRRRLFLRAETAQGTTLAAWAVALHEAAHAGQDREGGSHLKNRQTCISTCRYLPMAVVFILVGLMLGRMLPAKLGLMAMLGVLGLLAAWNLGTLSVEFAANRRLSAFLENHLRKHPQALERLNELLFCMAIREVGDAMKSPRYFFLSALPGSGTARPKK